MKGKDIAIIGVVAAVGYALYKGIGGLGDMFGQLGGVLGGIFKGAEVGGLPGAVGGGITEIINPRQETIYQRQEELITTGAAHEQIIEETGIPVEEITPYMLTTKAAEMTTTELIRETDPIGFVPVVGTGFILGTGAALGEARTEFLGTLPQEEKEIAILAETARREEYLDTPEGRIMAALGLGVPYLLHETAWTIEPTTEGGFTMKKKAEYQEAIKGITPTKPVEEAAPIPGVTLYEDLTGTHAFIAPSSPQVSQPSPPPPPPLLQKPPDVSTMPIGEPDKLIPPVYQKTQLGQQIWGGFY